MRTTATSVAMLALALGGSTAARAGESSSVYTDISEKHCKVLPASGEPGDEEDGLRCKGPGGYELLVLYGDLRATVTVVAPDGKQHPLDYWSVVTHAFSTLGPRAEWRVHTDGRVTVPHALVVRVNAQEDAERPQRKTSWLAVAKITPGKICVTDRIKPGAAQNVEARIAADDAGSKVCLASAPM